MATVLRLARAGAKKAPVYHVVAADKRSPRDGRFIEKLGTYWPANNEVSLNGDRVDYWVGVGAVPTERVAGIIKRFKKAQAAEAATPAAE